MMDLARSCSLLQRALVLLFILFQVSAAQTTVNVSPPAKNAIPGSVFTLQVGVNGVTNLHLYHVILHFDNTMLRLESVTPGAFFPGTFFIYAPTALPSDTARFLTVDDALVGTQTRSGAGIFFSVQFRALQEGVSTVSLMEVDLRDGTNQPIGHTRVDGTVTGTYPAEVFVSPTYVPGSAGGHDYGFDAFSTVTAGVGAVTGSGTVHVLPGTYREQVYINKNLALLGAGAASTTIVPPVALMSQPFLPARQERPIIGVDSLGTAVVVDGLTVDGEGAGATQLYMTGVQYFKASGIISNCTVKRIRATPFNGMQMYIPILVNHDYPRSYAQAVEIHHDSVYDFGKTGIVVNHPGSTANIHDNVVTGQGPTSLNAQNGIQAGFGATATITGNGVSGIAYTGPDAAASSILFAGTAGTGTIRNNTVTNGQVGVYLSQDGTPGWSCSADVRGNHITSSASGTGTTDYYATIALSQGTALTSPAAGGRRLPPASAFDAVESSRPSGAGDNPLAAMSVSLAGNTFSSTTPATGTGAYLLAMNSSTQTVTGDSNTISGWSVGAVTDKDPAASLAGTWRHNAFSGNGYAMFDLSGTVQDARRNWWGNATGPRDIKTLPGTPDYNNPNGLGDSVGARIEYNPWFLDAAQTQLSYFPLTVNVTGNGTVSRTPDTSAYLYFTNVVLQAFPGPHYHFGGWSGDTVSAVNPITIAMTSARTVGALFAIDQYPLTVTVVGGGSVDKVPNQSLFDHGSTVTLTALPAPGYTFVGWSGDTTTGANPVTLTMIGPRAVTATFALNMYTLTTLVDGNGAVTRNPDQASYAHGTGVGLKATPAPGWHFTGWTGDSTAAADTLFLVMTGTRALTAHFAVNTYTLAITLAGSGSVAKTPDSASYTHGTLVGLKARPDPGYHFVGWTGDTTATVDTLSVFMIRNRSYTATFAVDVFPVNVTIAGSGNVTRVPALPGYPWGTTVTLTAVSGGSYSFLGWSGDTVTSAFSITLTVWGPVNVTASFIGDKYVSLPPDSLILTNPINHRLLRPARPGRDLYPIWTNLLSEVVAQGGFQPLSTESDQAGGMVLGLSFIQGGGSRWRPMRDSARVHGWVRLTKWRFSRNDGTAYNAVQRSLLDRSGTHTGRPRGLDILTATVTPHPRVLTGEYRLMPPKRHNNRLFAELVALKLNIAASQLGKAPEGFGELVFQQPGHPFHDLSITEISELTDSLLTYWQGRSFAEYDSVESAIARINRAFTAPLDTASWAGPGQLIVNGSIRLGTIPFLRGADGPPVILQRTSTARGDEEDFEDAGDDPEGMPVALLLYPNYPNPFNPSTTLSFVLRSPAQVTIRVFDILGRQVAELASGEELDEGEHSLEFYADGLASGVYFSRVEVRDLDEEALTTVETGKMLLLK